MPIYEYRCEKCGQEQNTIAKVGERPKSVGCPCGARARYHFSTPIIHTLSTHMMGAQGMKIGGDGSYVDYNLVDPATGKPAVITSLDQKKRLMKEKGLQYADGSGNDFVKWADKRKKTKPLWFS